MNSENRLLLFLAVLVSGALFFALFTRIKVWNSRKKSFKKVDVFAEPPEEIFNEFIDTITVKFDEVKEAVSDIFERRKGKSVKSIELDGNINNKSN
jgi:hypothetical protein